MMSILLLPIITLSQVVNYTFSETTGTYVAITGGTQLVTTTGGATSYDTDGSYFTLAAGSQFVFNGTTITAVNMTADGAVWLNPSTTTTGNGVTGPISVAAASSGVISAMGMDLRSTQLTSQVYERRWQDNGTEVIFQWQNAARYYSTLLGQTPTSTVERFSFQIRINKSTGVVSIIYGNMTTISNSTDRVPMVGLRGTVNTDFNNRRLTTSQPDNTPNWGAPNGTMAGTSNAHTVRFRSGCVPSTGLTFIWTPPPVCSGTPNPGNTLSSSLTSPPNGTVNLSLQNTTTGVGVTYVWESSTDNLTWTVFGSSSATQTSPPITLPTWFRSTVTCSGNSGISTTIQITLSYCTYNITNNDPTGITSVTFGTISNTSIGNPAYSDFTTQSTTVEQGGVYQLNVKVNTDGNWTVNTKVWVDWNQNYVFEVGEEYSLGSALNTTNGITSLSPLNITVPSGATLGETRMRIVSVEASDPVPLACGTQLYGEAEDYKLSIIPPTGLPVELLYFEGTKYPTFNLLKWSTASESNSDYFSIEVSTDGLTWKKIGEKKAAGNSNTKIDYSYTHSFDNHDINYYKLLQYDYDGVFKGYGPIGLDNTLKKVKLIRVTNLIGQEIDENYKGFVIELYEDGKVIRTIRY